MATDKKTVFTKLYPAENSFNASPLHLCYWCLLVTCCLICAKAANAVPINGPNYSETGNYTLTWNVPCSPGGYAPQHFRVEENDNIRQISCGSSYTLLDQPQGTYVYTVELCEYDPEINLTSCFGKTPHTVWVNRDGNAPYLKAEPEIIPGTVYGKLDYAATVSSKGSALVNFPIDVPRGVTPAATPSLALTYDSHLAAREVEKQWPRSIIGEGWDIAGFSSIRRCEQRIQNAPNLSFTATDRLCLDGEVLVNTVGSYWSSNSQYATERDTFVKVIAHGSSGTQWFEVLAPNGVTLRYGKTTQSKVSAGGTNVTYEWALEEIEDSFGNLVVYSYAKDDNIGEIYPIGIDYSGYSIDFEYASRTIKNPESTFGSKFVRRTVLLHTIRTYINGTPVREYRLDNRYGPNPADIFLEQFQVCGFSGSSPECYDPFTISLSPYGNIRGIDTITDNLGAFTKFQLFWTLAVSEYEADFLDNVLNPANCNMEDYNPGTRQTRLFVQRMEKSNGTNGAVSSWDFSSVDFKAWFSKENRGLSGYSSVRIVDNQTGTHTYTYNQLCHPFSGMKAATFVYDKAKTNGGELLSEVFYNIENRSLNNNKTQFPYMANVTTLNFEDSVMYGVTKVTTDLEINNNLIATKITLTEKAETASKVASNWNLENIQWTQLRQTEYENDILNWNIGFIEREEYAVEASGEDIRTFEHRYIREPNTTIPNSVTNFWGSVNNEFTVDYQYNAIGLADVVTVSSANFLTRTTSYSNFDDNRYPQTITQDLSITGPIYSSTSTVEYDLRFGNARINTDPNGLQQEALSDNLGRLQQLKNPNGALVNYHYDGCSNACGSVDGVNIAFQVRQESRHDFSTIFQGAPDVITSYDNLGRIIRVETQDFSGEWITVDTVYNNRGLVSKRSLPYLSGNPKFVTYSYDIRGRLEQQIQPDETPGITSDNPQTDFAYLLTNTGFAITSTDVVVRTDNIGVKTARTLTRQEIYNCLGQLIESIDGVGSSEEVTTEYDYDSFGNQDWVRVNGDDRTIVTTEFDLAGNPTKIVDPSAGEVNFIYDALGQILTQTDARGVQTTFEYDLIGRLIKRTDDSLGLNPIVNTWTYDTIKIGFLAQRNSPGFAEDYNYNGLTQLTSITNDVNLPTLVKNYKTLFTYDDYGRSKTQSFESSGQNTLTTYNVYNNFGYNSELRETNAGGQLLEKIAGTNNFGSVTESELGGINTQHTYDQYGQLTSISSQNGLLQDHVYNWWSNGTLHERGRNNGTIASEIFSYDSLNRLTSAQTAHTYDTRTLTFNYDALGNFTQKRDFSGGQDVNNYVYSAANPYQLSGVTINGISHTYTHDEAGNIVTADASDSNNDRTVAFNALGKPVDIRKGNLTNGVISNPTAQDQFQYGPDGYRFYKKTINKKIGIVLVGDITVIWPRPTMDQTLYLFGGAVEIVFPSEGTTTAIEKIYLGGAMHIREETVTSSSSRFEYLHADHLGSVDVITAENGVVITQNQFDPFGARRNSDWTGVGGAPSIDFQNLHTNQGYTRHEQLDSTGLIHMNGRVYDPDIGRFMSADPIVQAPTYSQSYNRYAYVFNNPLSFTDPSGYEADDNGCCFDFSGLLGSGRKNRKYDAGSIFRFNQLVQAEIDASIDQSLVDVGTNVDSPFDYSFPSDGLEVAGRGARRNRGASITPRQQIINDQVAGLIRQINRLDPSFRYPVIHGGIPRYTQRDIRFLENALGVRALIPAQYRTAVINSFRGEPTLVQARQDIYVYRHSGGAAGATGSPWFTPAPYARPGNAQRYLALPQGNTAQNTNIFIIPAGTFVVQGRVAPQVGNPGFGANAVGGGFQIYLPTPSLAIPVN